MNGKIRMPLTGDPNSYPPTGAVYVWVDGNRELKSMGSDGSIEELCSKSLSGLGDVDMDTVLDGQVLVYDLNNNKWVGQQIFDPETLNDSVTILENSVSVLQAAVDNIPSALGEDISSNAASIASNAGNIASTVGAVAANTDVLDAHDGQINQLETDIDNAEQEILSHTSLLDSHTLSISDLQSTVSDNTALLSNHTDNISSHTATIDSNTSRIAANEGVINFHSDELRHIQNDLIAGIDQDIIDIGDELDTLETEIESVELLANEAKTAADVAKERADDAYALAGGGGGIAPSDPVDPSSLIDENDVVQAEAIDGFLKVNNRLRFTGGSIRIGEGTGESDNDAGTGNEIAIGYRSCFGNAAKTNGIGIGIQSLYNVSGSANIGIGLNAGNSNSGNYNVSIGNSAGQYRYLSSSNLCLGYASGYNGKGSDNIYIGAWSGGVPTPNSDATSESNMLRIGAKGGTTAEYLDKELIIGNMNPDVDGGQWLLVNGNLRLKSPNGNQWTIKVDDSGNLSTEAVS